STSSHEHPTDPRVRDYEPTRRWLRWRRSRRVGETRVTLAIEDNPPAFIRLSHRPVTLLVVAKGPLGLDLVPTKPRAPAGTFSWQISTLQNDHSCIALKNPAPKVRAGFVAHP